MRSRYILCACLGLVVLACRDAKADPSKDISALMNEPFSLWDYGIVQMNKELDEDFRSHAGDRYVGSSVEYDFSKNSIRIDVKATPPDYVQTLEALRVTCKENIEAAKSWLGINPQGTSFCVSSKPGSLRSIACITKQEGHEKNSYVEDYFKHPGGYTTAKPKSDLGAKLDPLVEVTSWTVSDKLKIGVGCVGALRAPDISFSETHM